MTVRSSRAAARSPNGRATTRRAAPIEPPEAPSASCDLVTGSSQHAPQNAMTEPGEIERFHDRCSDLMRELLGELAETPDRPRTFPAIEDAIGWPRRRIASVLGGVSRLRHTEFGGRRPYRFLGDRHSASARWDAAARAWLGGRRSTAPSSGTATASAVAVRSVPASAQARPGPREDARTPTLRFATSAPAWVASASAEISVARAV